jgi:3-isopropylmalate/(R)-2-methylmalate dehydratase small subunit
MEIAPLVIASLGIRAVLAKSFARAFYRNGINGGLMLVETDTDGIDELDRLEVEMSSAAVRNLDKVWTRPGAGPQGVLKRIVEEGGLLPYIARHGGLAFTPPRSRAASP